MKSLRSAVLLPLLEANAVRKAQATLALAIELPVGADGAILELILREEIGHVAIGNRWYRHVCAQRGHDPVAKHADLATHYNAPFLRGPFNLDARRAAGFDEEELAALGR